MLERGTVGTKEIYMENQQEPVKPGVGGGGDGIDGGNNLTSIPLDDMSNGEANGGGSAHGARKKKVIYFADGSTMEDYEDDDDEIDTTATINSRTSVQSKSSAASLGSAPPPDPSKMQWPEWVRHYTSKAGTKTLSVLEGMGGSAAYFLGITTPKYQSEIDEYNRMVAKKKSQEEELVSWSSGPKTNHEAPVVDDVKSDNEKVEIEKY